jgi:hypothetical protein
MDGEMEYADSEEPEVLLEKLKVETFKKDQERISL